MRLRRRKKLHAITDDTLEEALTTLNLLIPLMSGELRCVFCEQTLTIDSLGGLFSEAGVAKVFCDSPECLTQIKLTEN